MVHIAYNSVNVVLVVSLQNTLFWLLLLKESNKVSFSQNVSAFDFSYSI